MMAPASFELAAQYEADALTTRLFPSAFRLNNGGED